MFMITLIFLTLAVPLAQLVLMTLIYIKSSGKIFKSASGSFTTASVALASFFSYFLVPTYDESVIAYIFFGGFFGIAALILLICYKKAQRSNSTDELPSLLHFIWGICICVGLVLWIVLFLWEILVNWG